MRKIKLLLAACALILGASAMQAKTDVTTSYLTNADLKSLDGWSILDGTMAKGGYQDWQAGGDVPVIEFYHSWNANPNAGAIGSTKTFNFSQTVNLPVGYYRLAVNAFYREGGNGNGTNTKAYIYAGEQQQYVVGLNEGGLNGYTGSNDLFKAANAFSKGDYSNEFDFHVSEAGEVEIGFHGYIDTYCSWCILGPVTLWEYTAADYMEDYRAKVEIATPLLSQKMNATVLQALQNAIVEESTLSTVDDVQNAVSTLTGAINDANNSIASYSSLKTAIDAYDANCALFDSYGIAAANEAGAANAKSAYENGTATDGAAEKAALDAAYRAGVLAVKQPADGLDMTAYITNPDFNSGKDDGWTKVTPFGGNCQVQGGSRMEYWAGNASNRAEASFNIYQEIENLPAGVYTVSAKMYNSLNGEGGDYTVFSPTCGVYGASGASSNESVALVDVEGDVLNEYTTDEILVFKGKMTLGVKNTVTPMAARWFLFDDVKLTYKRQLTAEELAANIEPTGIVLDQPSLDLEIFGTGTLVATIEPDNADDKTISWSSSDEKVATVNNEGVVTAVGLGNATITASANGADNLKATATVTVTDVKAADAPEFFSTSIAEEDYYILNAATGKFLGGANDWGTRAGIIEHGIPFTAAAADGKYTLDSHTFADDSKHFLAGDWIDGASTPLFITPVGGGKFTISLEAETKFLSAAPNSTFVNQVADANSVLAQWYFLSKADRDKMLETSSDSNPVDATYYIKEPNFNRNQKNNSWTGKITTIGGEYSNFNAMVQNAAADVYQEIVVPNGTYTVKVQACTDGSAVFFANDMEVDIAINTGDITNQSSASKVFTAGNYVNELTVTVTDGTLKIGVKSDDTDKVLYFDNFELYMTDFVKAESITVGDAEYATLVSTNNLDFSGSEIKAFTAKVEGSKVVLTQIDKVKAFTPVVLYAKGGKAEDISVFFDAADDATDNELVAGTGDVVATEGEGVTNYILNKVGDKVGFYYANGNIVATNHAYLPVKKTGEARLSIVFADEATGIASVKGAAADKAIYNLKGQRIAKAQKGLYIINGKKAVIK